MSADALIAEAQEAVLLGRTAEARALCARALRALGAARGCAQSTRAACAVLRLEARSHAVDGDLAAALDALAAATAVAEALGDPAELGPTLNYRATVHLQRGDLDAAEALYAGARAEAARSGDRRLGVSVALNRGIIANIRGDLAAAEGHYADALPGARELGMRREVAAALNNLGQVFADQGRWDEAERAYRECARVATELEDLDSLAIAHVNLAEVWVGRGDYARARAACDRAMATSRRAGTTTVRGEVHRQLGIVAREQGLADEAAWHLAEAAAVAEARGDLLLQAETAREQADLCRRLGRNRETLQTLNRARRLFEQLRARRDLADVTRRMGRLEDDFVAVARRWGESIEAKDRYTQGHCQRVADLACLIAEHAGPAHDFDAQALFWFRIGALLHDVGKLHIPEDVLNKPGKLTDAEFALMRGHAEAGVALLADVEFPWDVRPVVLSHHERWDGKGYPHRLAGEAIPLTARILGVADVYDALTSVRSYKRAMTHEEAMAILRKDAGTAFDPQVVAWFEAVAPAWAARCAAAAPAHDDPGAAAAQRTVRRRHGLDELTGLPGRAAFVDECARVLAARAGAGATGTPSGPPAVGLLLLRLTTSVPGPGGPADAGFDVALRTAADVVSCNTRGSDFVARCAPDELVVLLPDLDAAAVREVAERLHAALHAALHAMRVRHEHDPWPAGLDVRTGCAQARRGATPETLLAAAAAALARAGRGRRRSVVMPEGVPHAGRRGRARAPRASTAK